MSDDIKKSAETFEERMARLKANVQKSSESAKSRTASPISRGPSPIITRSMTAMLPSQPSISAIGTDTRYTSPSPLQRLYTSASDPSLGSAGYPDPNLKDFDDGYDDSDEVFPKSKMFPEQKIEPTKPNEEEQSTTIPKISEPQSPAVKFDRSQSLEEKLSMIQANLGIPIGGGKNSTPSPLVSSNPSNTSLTQEIGKQPSALSLPQQQGRAASPSPFTSSSTESLARTESGVSLKNAADAVAVAKTTTSASQPQPSISTFKRTGSSADMELLSPVPTVIPPLDFDNNQTSGVTDSTKRSASPSPAVKFDRSQSLEEKLNMLQSTLGIPMSVPKPVPSPLASVTPGAFGSSGSGGGIAATSDRAKPSPASAPVAVVLGSTQMTTGRTASPSPAPTPTSSTQVSLKDPSGRHGDEVRAFPETALAIGVPSTPAQQPSAAMTPLGMDRTPVGSSAPLTVDTTSPTPTDELEVGLESLVMDTVTDSKASSSIVTQNQQEQEHYQGGSDYSAILTNFPVIDDQQQDVVPSIKSIRDADRDDVKAAPAMTTREPSGRDFLVQPTPGAMTPRFKQVTVEDVIVPTSIPPLTDSASPPISQARPQSEPAKLPASRFTAPKPLQAADNVGSSGVGSGNVSASGSVSSVGDEVEGKARRFTISGGGRPKAKPEDSDSRMLPSKIQDQLTVPSAFGGLVTALTPIPRLDEQPNNRFNNNNNSYVQSQDYRSNSVGPRDRQTAGSTSGPPIQAGGFTPQPRRVPDSKTAIARLTGKTPDHPSTRVSFENWSLARREKGLVGSWDDARGEGADGEKTVRVAIRVRPFTIGEIQADSRRVVSVNGNKLILVNPNAFEADPDAIAAAAAAVSLENMRCNDWAKIYKYDECLWSYDPNDTEDTYVDQKAIYATLGQEIVMHALRGRSSSCFAYGHTGTGKTHTMFGSIVPSNHYDGHPEEDTDGKRSSDLSDDAGLIPRVFTDLINAVSKDPQLCDDTVITMSFMEIYNEKIKDLLSFRPDGEQPDLRIREHPEIGPIVDGLSKVEVRSALDARQLLFAGHLERATAPNAHNPMSSRSHAVVTLELSPVGYEAQLSRSSQQSLPWKAPILQATAKVTTRHLVRVQMVDLAGSEKETLWSNRDDEEDHRASTSTSHRRKSGVESRMVAINKDLKEAEKLETKMIRRSLSTLGYIIKALGRGVSAKGLPYRDSILTWILKDGLTGKSRISMIGTVSPSHLSYDETLSTLKYAERLCLLNMRGPGSPTRVAIGDTIDPQLSLTLTNEYSRLKRELGGDRPGTRASRMLLQQTITDPQQRLAKLDSQRGGYGSEQWMTGPGDLREQFRQLHNQQIELQIELEATRSDRDALRLELQNLREATAVGGFDPRRPGGRSAIFELSEALKQAEKEIQDLRSLCNRKDQDIEQLVAELAEERQARSTIEDTTKAQTSDLIIRMEAFQRSSQVATQEMHKALGEAQQSQREREMVTEENKQLRKAIITEKQQAEAHAKELETLLRNSHEALRSYQEAMKQPQEAWKQSQEALKQAQDTIRHLQDSLRHSQEQLRRTQDDLVITTKERNEVRVQVDTLERDRVQGNLREAAVRSKLDEVMREARVQLLSSQQLMESRFKSEVEILTKERDNLASRVRQQENTLGAQQQQKETSIKMLYQRQAALADLEQRSASYNGSDEIGYLQDTLLNLLSREGQYLQSGTDEAKRLIGMISSIREKLQDANLIQDKFEAEKSHRQDLEDQVSELRSALQRSSNTNQVDKLLHELEYLKKKAAEGEANAQYWQQLAKKTNSMVGNAPNTAAASAPSAIEGQLRSENNQLREQLEDSQVDAQRARQELEAAKEDMQREFSSLWLAVQHLNKMDTAKESTLKELVSERDRAVVDKRELAGRLQQLAEENSALKKEMQEIDMELLDYIDAEGIEIEQLNIRIGPLNELRKKIPREKRSPTRLSKHRSGMKNSSTPLKDPTYSQQSLSQQGGNNQGISGKYMGTGFGSGTPVSRSSDVSNVSRRISSLDQGMEQHVEEMSQFLEKDREKSENQQNRMRRRAEGSSAATRR